MLRRRTDQPGQAPYALPVREWLRGTELIKMFIFSGYVLGETPQSMLLVSEPGSGKTELLERFVKNPTLHFASDVTMRGLFPFLKAARDGHATHLVATEFQKFFLRRHHVAEATLGTMCQMMEEGVGRVLIGDTQLDFGGARAGFIGAITGDTAKKWTRRLRELGFWSRCAAFDWEMTSDEMREVMTKISSRDRSDLEPVLLNVPIAPVDVAFPERLSDQLRDYTYTHFREYAILRVFVRFRVLAMACALMDGRQAVAAYDVEKVVAFHPYWSRMIR